MVKLLLVEDNLGLREQMKWALNADYEVLEAETLEGCLDAQRKQRPGVICLDMGLENKPERGLEIIDAVLGQDRLAKIIVITSNMSPDLGRRAVERGAFDFLQKPVDIDLLKVILERARRMMSFEKPAAENATVGLPSEADNLMIGRSEAMRKIFEHIRKLAKTGVNVLLTGESGTGKELCARAIHYHSMRRNEIFVPINCGSIPASLMESELFGYVKGAFTGANTDKMGLIESAHKGTLFLDEIGDMPMALQVKLLRFLQDQKLQRVGETTFRALDVRIIAATNKTNLAEKNNTAMRTDLYYRLSEFEINLPPLRDRKDDIPLIAAAIIEANRAKFNQPRLKLSKRAEQMLQNYSWPGNVRELENKLNRASITCAGQIIEAEDLQLSETSFTVLSYREARQMFDRNFILNALKQAKGNISLAAKVTGLTRPTLYDMMKKNGITVQMEAKMEEKGPD
ncbi:MAG TPA: sigma-54 dependent transcriptional regulator [Fibrobacteria bacterium]|nr:sigma-54 dependent transcriptional regulator [Fibrobacteria bacterium]